MKDGRGGGEGNGRARRRARAKNRRITGATALSVAAEKKNFRRMQQTASTPGDGTRWDGTNEKKKKRGTSLWPLLSRYTKSLPLVDAQTFFTRGRVSLISREPTVSHAFSQPVERPSSAYKVSRKYYRTKGDKRACDRDNKRGRRWIARRKFPSNEQARLAIRETRDARPATMHWNPAPKNLEVARVSERK